MPKRKEKETVFNSYKSALLTSSVELENLVGELQSGIDVR